MHRQFITLVVATAMAVAGFAAKARADEDLNRALAGLAVLAIVGKLIHDSRDRDEPSPPPAPVHNWSHTPQAPAWAYRPPLPAPGYGYRPYPAPSYVPPHPHRIAPRPWFPQPPAARPVPTFSRDLPGFCLRSFRVNNREVRLLGAGCLQQNYRHSAQLPYACQFSFHTSEGSRTGYEPVCLRERGYRIARH